MPKRVLCVLMLSMAVPTIAVAQAAQSIKTGEIRLAYVSPQRAFYDSNEGKAARARLDVLESQTAREVDARNARLKALQQELTNGMSLLSEPARRSRQQEIERVEIDLKRFLEDALAQFLGVRRDLENAFLAKFAPAVDSIAKTRGLLFILNQDSGVLAWADPSLDITADVVAVVNAP